MTDTSQSKGKTPTNITVDVLLRMVAQNITPVIVGFLCAKAPILNEATWFEITVFALAGIGNMINNFSFNCIWDKIAALILWWRRGSKKVDDAKDQPLP
jgi:hypothetical protein